MRSAIIANLKVYDEASRLSNDINEFGGVKLSPTAELMNSREKVKSVGLVNLR